MSNIECPRCKYYSDFYNAPKGKVVRNPYASGSAYVFDNCDACSGTGNVPDVVVQAITDAFPKSCSSILAGLRWSTDHFSFVINGMYVGCEIDGYLHS